MSITYDTLITYANRVIPIHWWKKEIQERYHDHIGPASILLATSVIVSYVWGKSTAVGFLALAGATYPFSHKQIKYYMFLEAYATVQAVACVAVPILCSKVPLLAAWSLPFHVALAYSILTREWRLGQVSAQIAGEIKELRNLNDQLKEQTAELETNSTQLDVALKELMSHQSKQRELFQQSQDLVVEEDALAQRFGIDFKRLNEKLKHLLQVCSFAAESEGLKNKLHKIDETEQQLQAINEDIRSKTDELEQLKEKIKELTQNLSEVLSQAMTDERQAHDVLERFRSSLTLIINRKT